MSAPPLAINDIDDRAIDQSLANWVLARTGSPLLASAVRAASRAEGLGHACAQLAYQQTDAGFDPDMLDALRQQAWVGDGSTFTPFVLDTQQRFYLWRNWQHETKLAAAIVQRCADRRLPISVETLAADLQWLFADMPPGATDGQRAAVAAVPGARLFVLTGGPGTGKTTTVVRMLLLLLRHAAACGLPEQPSIALAAPTGKAAQRLAQAIAKGNNELQDGWPEAPAELISDETSHGEISVSREVIAFEHPETEALRLTPPLPKIPHADVRTLHRLLG
ncbi:MAG: AAA family ATPase, partial [Rhodanobacter sp.]